MRNKSPAINVNMTQGHSSSPVSNRYALSSPVSPHKGSLTYKQSLVKSAADSSHYMELRPKSLESPYMEMRPVQHRDTSTESHYVEMRDLRHLASDTSKHVLSASRTSALVSHSNGDRENHKYTQDISDSAYVNIGYGHNYHNTVSAPHSQYQQHYQPIISKGISATATKSQNIVSPSHHGYVSSSQYNSVPSNDVYSPNKTGHPNGNKVFNTFTPPMILPNKPVPAYIIPYGGKPDHRHTISAASNNTNYQNVSPDSRNVPIGYKNSITESDHDSSSENNYQQAPTFTSFKTDQLVNSRPYSGQATYRPVTTF